MKVIKSGIIHGLAFCSVCEWSDGLRIELKNGISELTRNAKRHVAKTGHSVTIEKGTSTTYSL